MHNHGRFFPWCYVSDDELMTATAMVGLFFFAGLRSRCHFLRLSLCRMLARTRVGAERIW